MARPRGPIRKKNCIVCDTEFVCKYRVGIGVWTKRKCCSSACASKSQITRTRKNCIECEKEFETTYERIKLCSTRCSSLWRSKNLVGPKAGGWKGGRTSRNRLERGTMDYRVWRVAVFMRDDHTCTICKKRGVYLEAHHIKPFSTHPELRYAIDNGKTLCIACHAQVDAYRSNFMNYKLVNN